MATIESMMISRPRRPDEQRLVLPAVNWQTYQAVSHALTGRHVRLTYDGENLEFMTISPRHGNCSRLLGQFVIVLTEEFDLPWKSFGDMTCDREDVGRGLEPDESFYLVNEPLVRGVDRIDLETDPPPDLTIEVDITRSSRDRMGIYAALQVPEVWRYDGSILVAFRLGSDGKYESTPESAYFPAIPIAELGTFLQRRGQMDENSLIREFRQWVRNLRNLSA